MKIANYIFDLLFCNYVPKPQIKIVVENLLNNDPEISYLNKRMMVPVLIKDCGEGIRSLYHIKNKEIWIDPVKNDINSVREPLLHEFIHAYDHQVNHIPITTIKGLAKSEIHAMKLCECSNAWFKKRCTKLKATEAVSLSINKEEMAVKSINEVFEETYNDGFLSNPYD